MTINGINKIQSQATPMGVGQETDSVSKNIQDQIANTQKQLQELSENEDMNLEAKMKKRQELTQQINDLNNQLRQHQIELRKQQREEAQKQKEDTYNNTQNSKNAAADKQKTGFSTTSMQAMVSADASMKKAQVQGRVAAEFEGRTGVLETEIMLDESRATNGRTANVSAKKEQLAEARQKAADVTAARMDSLKEANSTMNEAQGKPDNSAVKVTISKEGMKSYRKQLQALNSNAKSDGTVIEKKQALIKQAKNYQFENHYDNELAQRANALKEQRTGGGTYSFSDKEEDYGKAYKALYDEIVQSYQNGTREVYTDDENAEAGFRKLTMEEELGRLDKAFHKATNQLKIDKKATKILGDYKEWLQQVKTKKPVKSSRKETPILRNQKLSINNRYWKNKTDKKQ